MSCVTYLRSIEDAFVGPEGLPPRTLSSVLVARKAMRTLPYGRGSVTPRQRGIPSADSARQPLSAVAGAKRYDTNLKTLWLGGSVTPITPYRGTTVREWRFRVRLEWRGLETV